MFTWSKVQVGGIRTITEADIGPHSGREHLQRCMLGYASLEVVGVLHVPVNNRSPAFVAAGAISSQSLSASLRRARTANSDPGLPRPDRRGKGSGPRLCGQVTKRRRTVLSFTKKTLHINGRPIILCASQHRLSAFFNTVHQASMAGWLCLHHPKQRRHEATDLHGGQHPQYHPVGQTHHEQWFLMWQ